MKLLEVCRESYSAFWVCFGCCLLFFSFGSSVAAEKENRLFLAAALSPPHAYYDDYGVLKGIIIDMVDLMNELSDYEIEIYFVPPPRILIELAEGRADLGLLPSGVEFDAVADKIDYLSASPVVLASLKSRQNNLHRHIWTLRCCQT